MQRGSGMKLRVDLTARPPAVVLLNDSCAGLTMSVEGTLRGSVVDDLLVSTGAGRFVGHHAEILVEWLRLQLSAQALEVNVATIGVLWPVDQSGRWMAVPVEWADDSVDPLPSRTGATLQV